MTHNTWMFRTLFAALCIGAAPVLRAQATGSVSGTVTDRATGAPVVGARVAIECEEADATMQCLGREPTDSLGQYRRRQLPVGTFTLVVHCPSPTSGIGPEVLQRAVTIHADSETVVNVRVPPGHCFEPKYAEHTGVFRGYWTPEFESGRFLPCADPALGVKAPLLPGKRLVVPTAFAVLNASATAQWRHITLPRRAPLDEFGDHVYFVVWHGTLKGPGAYGQLGVAEFHMLVDSVRAVRATGPATCRIK